ncbi:hypothetical protein [Paracidovorax valerianellae]|uniref:Uncharacterized protein n=1 Tax=Paracidovorax valerianellae TaxID=187868 RepID=A0A1G6MRB5_9BURK|nr:hypothetical protein [Paracidovorax valerianellae]MDA8443944.1 hypothetical protein [Paracidovorax valerianellae]SDC58080.1 hypothetical protein SAMN05192589_102489 [Paracidovorax valerianellae]
MFGLSKLGIGRKSSDTQTQPKEGDKKSSGSPSGKTSRHSHAAPSGMPPPRGQSGANASDQGARPRTRIGGESSSARPLSVKEQRHQQLMAEAAAQGGVYAQGGYTPKPKTEKPPAHTPSSSSGFTRQESFDPDMQTMMFNTPAEREFYQHMVNPGAQAQSGAAAETTPAAPERRTFGRSTQIQNTEYDASGRQAPSQRS